MPDEQPGAVAGLSLTDLLDRISASSNPELEIVALTAARARQDDPELAEALYYCAIPRQFDAVIIGVLRQAPSEVVSSSFRHVLVC